jgi:hypothetical protein
MHARTANDRLTIRAGASRRSFGQAVLLSLVGICLTSCQPRHVSLLPMPQVTIPPLSESLDLTTPTLEMSTAESSTSPVRVHQVSTRREGAVREEFPTNWLPEQTARPWRKIVVHHSASAAGSVETIDAEHRQRVDAAGEPWLGIGYHFVIGSGAGMQDGQVTPTFRWREQLAGAHAGVADVNATGIGICLIGNFEDAPPTPRQWDAAVRLTRALADRYDIAPADIVRHGDLKATACPGRHFPWTEFQTAVAANAQTLE